MSAQEYNKGIRAHWSVEAMHYVKDVTFGEDASLIRTKNAPTNFSIIRNITMNILRREKYINFPQAIRMIGGNIKKLLEKMHLSHLTDKKLNGETLSAYSAPLEDVLINEDVLKMVFMKQDCPQDDN